MHMTQLSKFRETLHAAGAVLTPELLDKLLIEKSGAFTLHYAPFEYVNQKAKVVIVGITPGLQQAELALTRAAEDIRSGLDDDQVLQRAKVHASFGGSMRSSLVRMLDSIGMAQRLEIKSCSSLWADRSDLVHFTSCIVHPLLINGKNYSGTPPLLSTPWMKKLAKAYLVDEVSKLRDDVIWIPLGREPTSMLNALAAEGAIRKDHVLTGLPHPSGANAERIAAFLGAKPPEACSPKTNAVELLGKHAKLVSQLAAL